MFKKTQFASKTNSAQLYNLNRLARLMDTQFRIPGTNIRFGFDGIIGLIPGVGDLVSLAISSYLISSAAKNGASGYVVARMVLNIAVDTIIGSIPLLGDIFDVAFKANIRNVRLLQRHYVEGKHRGSANKIIFPLVIILLLIFAAIIWLSYKLIVWLF